MYGARTDSLFDRERGASRFDPVVLDADASDFPALHMLTPLFSTLPDSLIPISVRTVLEDLDNDPRRLEAAMVSSYLPYIPITARPLEFNVDAPTEHSPGAEALLVAGMIIQTNITVFRHRGLSENGYNYYRVEDFSERTEGWAWSEMHATDRHAVAREIMSWPANVWQTIAPDVRAWWLKIIALVGLHEKSGIRGAFRRLLAEAEPAVLEAILRNMTRMPEYGERDTFSDAVKFVRYLLKTDSTPPLSTVPQWLLGTLWDGEDTVAKFIEASGCLVPPLLEAAFVATGRMKGNAVEAKAMLARLAAITINARGLSPHLFIETGQRSFDYQKALVDAKIPPEWIDASMTSFDVLSVLRPCMRELSDRPTVYEAILEAVQNVAQVATKLRRTEPYMALGRALEEALSMLANPEQHAAILVPLLKSIPSHATDHFFGLHMNGQATAFAIESAVGDVSDWTFVEAFLDGSAGLSDSQLTAISETLENNKQLNKLFDTKMIEKNGRYALVQLIEVIIKRVKNPSPHVVKYGIDIALMDRRDGPHSGYSFDYVAFKAIRKQGRTFITKLAFAAEFSSFRKEALSWIASVSSRSGHGITVVYVSDDADVKLYSYKSILKIQYNNGALPEFAGRQIRFVIAQGEGDGRKAASMHTLRYAFALSVSFDGVGRPLGEKRHSYAMPGSILTLRPSEVTHLTSRLTGIDEESRTRLRDSTVSVEAVIENNSMTIQDKINEGYKRHVAANSDAAETSQTPGPYTIH